jgi:hypothetical protein
MASCPQCDGFTQRFNIGGLPEYLDLVRQLIEIVNQGMRSDPGDEIVNQGTRS